MSDPDIALVVMMDKGRFVAANRIDSIAQGDPVVALAVHEVHSYNGSDAAYWQ